MKTTTTLAFRRRYLYTYALKDFENYEDYFLYLHLNSRTQLLHALGTIIGMLMFPWAVYRLFIAFDVLPSVLYVAAYYGSGYISHILCDGKVSKTVGQPTLAYFWVTTMNFKFLMGLIGEDEKAFMKKYPHVLWVYSAEHQPPVGVLDGGRRA
jgi:hypothetical protein